MQSYFILILTNIYRYLRKIGAGLPPHLGHAGLNVVMHTDRAIRPPESPQARPIVIPDRPSYC